MKAIFKRVVFKDEWLEGPPRHRHWFIANLQETWAWVWPPRPLKTREFTDYALGFRWEATPAELELIRQGDLFGQPALQLRDYEPPFTFAELLGPEFIPEINSNQAELFQIEAKVRSAALVWTHSFENMKGSD